MKRIAVLIIAVIMTFSLVSCGANSNPDKFADAVIESIKSGDAEYIIDNLSDDFSAIAASSYYSRTRLGMEIEEMAKDFSAEVTVKTKGYNEREFMLLDNSDFSEVVELLNAISKYEDVDFDMEDLKYYTIEYTEAGEKIDEGCFVLVKEGGSWNILLMILET